MGIILNHECFYAISYFIMNIHKWNEFSPRHFFLYGNGRNETKSELRNSTFFLRSSWERMRRWR